MRKSLEEAYRSDSSEDEDIEEFDPLNYDEGTLKRKKQKKSRSNIDDGTVRPLHERKSWARRHLVPSKFCWWMIGLFFVVVILLLSAGGIWVRKAAPEDGQSDPVYPSPLGGADKEWEESYRKAADLVRQMTLVEKVNITTGVGWMMGMCVGNTGPVPRLGFPSLCLQDGPLGLRFTQNTTAFPAGITVGATWNRELMRLRGEAHGKEARLKGVNVLLGPAMGPIGRSPMGGRNWEGFGTDPVLQAVAAAETIKGIQSQGVIATAKHFIGNEQEHFRQGWEWGRPNAISSNIDDRTLHEMYAWPFAESVKAGVGSVMCSYNQVNNSYACQNSKLMNGILKDELGFQGFVQSDWLAQRGGVASALAGLDVTMPGDGLRWQDGKTLWGGSLAKAIFNGSVPVERLNDMATRVVAAWYQMKQDDQDSWKGPNFSSWTHEKIGLIHPASDDKATGVVNQFVNAQGDHGDIARRVAAEGIVLLKNNDNILPLTRSAWTQPMDRKFKVAIIGEDARMNKNGMNSCVDRGCNEGTLASGWGSGAVEFPYLITPLAALKEVWDKDNVTVSSYGGSGWSNGVEKLAKESDLCLVFANADGGEGFITSGGVAGDRNNLYLAKDGNKLIKKVANNCGGDAKSNVIVVLHTIGPVLMEEFVDLPNVKAIVYANLPGQESGNALVDVLFGDKDASGRLPYTIAKKEEDYGPSRKILTSTKDLVPQQNFTEGLFIDYRHFDYHNITPRYEFGYGLSYTTWHLSSGQINYANLSEKFKPLPSPRTDLNDGIKPPNFDTTLPEPSTALFPPGFRILKKYIYPYLSSIKTLVKGPPQYPTGFDITHPTTPSPAGGAQGGNPDLYTILAEVRATLTNTGKRPGSCVVQVYVSLPQNYIDEETGEVIVSPVRQLRNFSKTVVEETEGGRKEVKFGLTRKDFSYWSTTRGNWVLPTKGDIVIEVGFSSRDLPIRMTY
ncbi:beta-glucosidase [Tothia fuscella]|uniref:Probable beta-glucosidase E n=1 Tax=Tothia fuscella TaxID=1048955 RepID=A0A9P4NFJ1_9PEZI|nr:beta-glucosidase [Tothia fuscella]